MTDLLQILIGELGKTAGMFLALFIEKTIAKIIISDQVRGNGGSNYE